VHKVAKAAGKAAPAVAVVGALAAVPQVRDFVLPSTASAGHTPAAQVTDPDVMTGATAAGRTSHPASSGVRPYLPRHAVVSTGADQTRQTGRAGPPRRPAAQNPGHTPGAAGTPSHGSSTGSSGSAAGGASGSSHAVPKCTGTQGMLPDNYAAIVDFLVSHGYSDFAAAGIAGNIYQESKGDPESVGDGGGGLIGWTPLPAGYVTGNVSADLQTQLNALLIYNDQWSQFIPALNASTSATEAADLYMNDFERPGLPEAGNREAAAQAVATACGI
jgi:hypothetical protein